MFKCVGLPGLRLRAYCFHLVATASAISLLAGCNGSPTPATSGADAFVYQGKYPINIVCTTGMVADIVQQVAGEQATVSHLMGEGVDPHLYKASTADIDRLAAADLIFYSGRHLEGKMGDVFERMERNKPTYAVTDGIPEDRILEVSKGHYDPHLWFDVSLWSEAVGVVEQALARFDPSHAADYQSRSQKYRQVLAELHADCQRRIAEIPESRRVLVTAHDAFSYFGRAYHLEVKAIQGISTESEAGVKEINELVNFIVQRKIKAVFVETSVSDRNIKALVEGCQAQGHPVVIGGSLYSDAMGQAGTPDGTYIGMVRHNVDTIVEALR